jgi:two-component system response regulator
MAPTVLLVEDNPDHALFALKALRGSPPVAKVVWAKDGEEALALLDRAANQATEAAPELILLDIHLPKVNGHEVLRRVKEDARLRAIPVVMLTTSESVEDLEASYSAGANSYVAKPLAHGDFVAHISSLKQYWLVVNTMPAA